MTPSTTQPEITRESHDGHVVDVFRKDGVADASLIAGGEFTGIRIHTDDLVTIRQHDAYHAHNHCIVVTRTELLALLHATGLVKEDGNE